MSELEAPAPQKQSVRTKIFLFEQRKQLIDGKVYVTIHKHLSRRSNGVDPLVEIIRFGNRRNHGTDNFAVWSNKKDLRYTGNAVAPRGCALQIRAGRVRNVKFTDKRLGGIGLVKIVQTDEDNPVVPFASPGRLQ